MLTKSLSTVEGLGSKLSRHHGTCPTLNPLIYTFYQALRDISPMYVQPRPSQVLLGKSHLHICSLFSDTLPGKFPLLKQPRTQIVPSSAQENFLALLEFDSLWQSGNCPEAQVGWIWGSSCLFSFPLMFSAWNTLLHFVYFYSCFWLEKTIQLLCHVWKQILTSTNIWWIN